MQDWKRRNYVPLRAHRGLNSYVAKEPREEYQMDLMFLKDLEKELGQDKILYEGALLMVDISTNIAGRNRSRERTRNTSRES